MTKNLLAFIALGSTCALAAAPSYRNPLPLTDAGGRAVENCADPAVLRADDAWFMYCTSDALASDDQVRKGVLRHHILPMFRSTDLVRWTHVGDAFAAPPAWAEEDARLWSPEIAFIDGRYLLYYAATDTRTPFGGEPGCGEDSAIGVATAPSPTGPWTDLGRPLVAPRRAGPGCNFEWTIDPETLAADDGSRWLYYGSYRGGIEVRRLAPDGLAAPADGAVPIALASRYEGAEVVRRDGFYYLLLSSAHCCNGPLTGYGVFAARSASPTGPFVDADGNALLDAAIGGTPVLAMNGNRWVGPGHVAVVPDAAGQDWLVYHAVNRNAPYFGGHPGYTRRPVLLDALDWEGGWPRVAWGPSDAARVAPALRAGDAQPHRACARPNDQAGDALAPHGDEFDGPALAPRWRWVRPPAPGAWAVEGGTLRLDTQAADLHGGRNDAALLVQAAPRGDVLVETRVELDVPSSGCCYDFVQAGLAFYRDDDNYVRLTHVAIGATRQVEFAKEVGPVPQHYPRFGGTLVGTPGRWTWLRIVRRQQVGHAAYTAYSSRDGRNWTRGGTWTHSLGGG